MVVGIVHFWRRFITGLSAQQYRRYGLKFRIRSAVNRTASVLTIESKQEVISYMQNEKATIPVGTKVVMNALTGLKWRI